MLSRAPFKPDMRVYTRAFHIRFLVGGGLLLAIGCLRGEGGEGKMQCRREIKREKRNEIQVPTRNWGRGKP